MGRGGNCDCRPVSHPMCVGVDVQVCPLFAALPPSQQLDAFAPAPSGAPRAHTRTHTSAHHPRLYTRSHQHVTALTSVLRCTGRACRLPQGAAVHEHRRDVSDGERGAVRRGPWSGEGAQLRARDRHGAAGGDAREQGTGVAARRACRARGAGQGAWPLCAGRRACQPQHATPLATARA